MTYRSNAAEAWYPAPGPFAVESALTLNLLPPPGLTQPLWRSLAEGLRHSFFPAKLPPLQLTSRPVNLGLPLGDRFSLPWYRTVFTNIGDVLSPETLPPLELESKPIDVGELITDQLSHFWWASLIRNLADRVSPERLPALDLTSAPIPDILPKSWILLPLWSEVVDGPKVFYPDKPKPADTPRMVSLEPVPVADQPSEHETGDPTAADLLRDLRRSRIRQRIWIGLAVAQIAYLLVASFWLR